MTEQPDEHRDESVRRLVRLTRDALADAGDDGDLDEVAFARLRELRVARRRGRWRLGWVATVAVVALAAAGTVVAWRVGRAAAPLTFEIVEDAGAPGASPAARLGTRIVFSEGSEVAIGGGARAAVRDLRATGARIVLARGLGRAFFVPRPSALWRLDVGPYAVEVGGEVTGTAFDVEWTEDTQTLELWQRTGSARVNGPLIGSGMALTRGQHLSTHVRDNKIVLDSHPR